MLQILFCGCFVRICYLPLAQVVFVGRGGERVRLHIYKQGNDRADRRGHYDVENSNSQVSPAVLRSATQLNPVVECGGGNNTKR